MEHSGDKLYTNLLVLQFWLRPKKSHVAVRDACSELANILFGKNLYLLELSGSCNEFLIVWHIIASNSVSILSVFIWVPMVTWESVSQTRTLDGW